jgi:hypothetical protein
MIKLGEKCRLGAENEKKAVRAVSVHRPSFSLKRLRRSRSGFSFSHALAHTRSHAYALADAHRVQRGLQSAHGNAIDDKWANSRPHRRYAQQPEAALPSTAYPADIIYEVLAEGGSPGCWACSKPWRAWEKSAPSVPPAPIIGAGPGTGRRLPPRGRQSRRLRQDQSLVGHRPGLRQRPYEGTLYWRDQERIKTAGTSTACSPRATPFWKLFPTYSFRQEHKDGYTYEMSFLDDGTPAGGETALEITVPFHL